MGLREWRFYYVPREHTLQTKFLKENNTAREDS